MTYTLAIDFGSKYIGVALVAHARPLANRVDHAATLVVEPKPLNALVEPRAACRRLRRTRKTHRRRLQRLAQALNGIGNAAAIVRFCRRRGFSHEEKRKDEESSRFQVQRSTFFKALKEEISRQIAPDQQARVLALCSRHLNEACRREAELRPARFENRGPSRCQWAGCSWHVPRVGNDFRGRLQQALFAWMRPVFVESPDPPKLRRSLDHWIGELDGLAWAFHALEAKDPSLPEVKEHKKRIRARRKRIFNNLLQRLQGEGTAEVVEQCKSHWADYYEGFLKNLCEKPGGGRVRYCRLHSREFVDYLLAGREIPQRQDLTEADLVSRKQQILFRRLWRWVEHRLLPMSGGRIDRVVVERVAFDVLAGPFKARQKLPEETAKAMYWSGPQLGFASRWEMLQKEFGGRCAYCGQPGATEQVEHLLPQSQFPFDSYFNVVPACSPCNSRKGPRAALEAGLLVHPEAYQAYASYVRQKKVPHVFHTVKLGLLNLLQKPESVGQAEKMLGLLSSNLLTMTASQRSPRPLARYLATYLEKRTGHRPQIAFCAGRHTAIYRSILLPDFDKRCAREQEDLRHHAVDAILLGCDLPSITAQENVNWNQAGKNLPGWLKKAQAAAPDTLEGLPRVEASPGLPFFEEELDGGYRLLALSAFNWNRKRKATHQLDPFGQTKGGLPLKREPAQDVLKDLLDEQKRMKRIARIAHPALRHLLEKQPDQAAKEFVTWLRQTTLAGLRQAPMSNHPADVARREALERFCKAPVEKILSKEESIPENIGVRCLIIGSEGKIDVVRKDGKGAVIHRFQAQPVVRELYVGYRMQKGQLDRSKPVLVAVNQIHGLEIKKGCKTPELPESSALRGRPLGSAEKLQDFLTKWREEFSQFCAKEGIVKLFKLTQGCVIQKTDGSRFQIRNFDKTKPWSRAEAFQEIQRVYRSPLRVFEL